MSEHLVPRLERLGAVIACPAVHISQVYVAGDDIVEMPEQFLSKHFRHDVGALVFGGHRHNGNGPLFNVLTEEVVPYIYVLGSFHGCGVVGDFHCGAVVFVYYARPLDCETQ